MNVEVIYDPAAFRDAVNPFLKADPVRNINVLTTLDRVIDGRAADGPDLHGTCYAVVLDAGAVIGLASVRGGRAQLSNLPLAVLPELVRVLADAVPNLLWVQAEPRIALRFAELWQTTLGKDFEQVVAKRLHRLGVLIPHEAPGRPRLATMADHELGVRWDDAFMIDVNEQPQPEVRTHVQNQIEAGLLWLWELDGEPVTMVGHQATVAGASRVGPVYTPPELRKRGFGSALTAYVSGVLLGRGPEVCLFTDLSNPTSNKIYAAIGYEPFADFVKYAFD